jgi:hypothetical protein
VTTAFVLSGGGSLGAVQVGMLQALGERDFEPDLLVGTSARAINAAFVAGPAGYPCDLPAAPTTAVGVALQALTLLIQHQLIGEVARCAGPARLRVLPPLCPLKVSAADFSHPESTRTVP